MSNRITDHQISRRTVIQGAAGVAALSLGVGSLRQVGAQESLKIAFSVPGLNFPFFVHMMDLAEQHAKEIGGIDFIKLDGQQNGSPSSTKQSNDLEAMIAQKINGLVISPNDANALAPSIQAVIDAGITVVTVDRDVTDVKTLAHVGADNVKGGEAQGAYLVKILADGGDIFELEGQPGSTPAIDRHKGLHNILDAQDKIKVIFDQTAEFDRAKGLSVTESALEANSSPKAIVCANDDMAFGAIEAASGKNLTIPIIGFDALPEALQNIAAGTQAATVEQFPGKQAATAIDILVAFLRDKKSPDQHDTFLTPIIIDQSNLAEAERAVEAGVAAAGTPAATPAS
jgi:inositol transport system substrate-binding protein